MERYFAPLARGAVITLTAACHGSTMGCITRVDSSKMREAAAFGRPPTFDRETFDTGSFGARRLRLQFTNFLSSELDHLTPLERRGSASNQRYDGVRCDPIEGAGHLCASNRRGRETRWPSGCRVSRGGAKRKLQLASMCP